MQFSYWWDWSNLYLQHSGMVQNYTLLLFHLYYTGVKECGIHSSPAVYILGTNSVGTLFSTYIYTGEKECGLHSFSPVYIQEQESVAYT